MAREKKKTRNKEDRDIVGCGAREKKLSEEERRRYRSPRREREATQSNKDRDSHMLYHHVGHFNYYFGLKQPVH